MNNVKTYIGSRLVIIDCPNCGWDFGAAVVGEGKDLRFCVADNTCAQCGHVCTNKDIKESEEI